MAMPNRSVIWWVRLTRGEAASVGWRPRRPIRASVLYHHAATGDPPPAPSAVCVKWPTAGSLQGGCCRSPVRRPPVPPSRLAGAAGAWPRSAARSRRKRHDGQPANGMIEFKAADSLLCPGAPPHSPVVPRRWGHDEPLPPSMSSSPTTALSGATPRATVLSAGGARYRHGRFTSPLGRSSDTTSNLQAGEPQAVRVWRPWRCLMLEQRWRRRRVPWPA